MIDNWLNHSIQQYRLDIIADGEYAAKLSLLTFFCILTLQRWRIIIQVEWKRWVAGFLLIIMKRNALIGGECDLIVNFNSSYRTKVYYTNQSDSKT